MTPDQAVEQIIKAIDKRTLLGAAYDCMSDGGQVRFKQSLLKIINATVLSSGQELEGDEEEVQKVCLYCQGHYGSTTRCSCLAGLRP